MRFIVLIKMRLNDEYFGFCLVITQTVGNVWYNLILK